MATLLDLVAKVRTELNDQPRQFAKSFTGDGTTKDFNLGYKPIDANTLLVTAGNTTLTNPTTYTVEAGIGVVHTVTAPGSNVALKVVGSVYRYFSDAEIEYFVNTAVTQHLFNRTDGFGRQMTISMLPEVEVYPITILSTIEALYALATDASFDIDIQAPDGVTIPRAQRYSQLMGLIAQRQEQYRNICSALNIGLWRIEMGVLRRVSRTTNKLVPVYMAQEIDDARKPERVYLQNDLTGRAPMPTTVGIYDLIMEQGDNFSVTLDFPDDTNFDDLVFKAQVRTYPGSPTLWATMSTLVTSPSLKKLQISLTKEQTTILPVRCSWDIQATSLSDPTFERTYLRGQVFVNQQVTED
ncbi:hypothetical protein UFOVP225_33 [uncultured Caudovirales phage]|uniref:Uncharacterized protein n=1 Tax=uncultured Caudovirales phage TaxID=2100421 RepID=A0A6J5L9K4_9CAUD|nr:hypothetical protein UFOVP113_46 [uncultured Caudovirales phage]CAB5219169.1 hypothetical protein UFOVP225_33 [uncultured Caudovirales phage]